MNQRDALKIAAARLLDDAQCHAVEYGLGEETIPDEWTAADLDRVIKGFRILAMRLEYTVTGERPARSTEDDPNQYPLFEES